MFQKELDLFNAIKDKLIKDLKESGDNFSRYDCYSEEHNLDIELKCRRSHYDDLIIEKKKYDALILRSKKFGTDPVYINSTPLGVWSFRLRDLQEPEWSGRGLPKSTDFDSTYMITKQVGYYSTKDGVEITHHFK
tara:strand:+ start:7900 stop:8304 length:405 start_codon:yes stop_codon:yes gene_type:complete